MPRFVGRVAELAVLSQALAAGSVLVLIEGEAGVGKTRLLREMLADHEPGAALVAECPPFRQPQTLAPVIDAVRNAAGPGAGRVAGLGLSALGGALRPLLPEWAAELPAALEPAEDATAARHRVFRALAEVLAGLEVGMLVVEDAHWADDATLEFLLFLSSGRTSGLSLVVTCRPEDVPADSLLRRLGSRRSSLGSEVRIGLGPLDEAQTAELVSAMLSGKPVTAQFARFLFERTDGVPLAVEESLRLMVDRDDLVWRRGELVRRRLSQIAVPVTIRDAVLERVQRLSDRAQQVLRAVAVLGSAAPADVIREVSGLEPAQVQAGLCEALDCGLLIEDDRGRAGFRHVLHGQVVYEAIPAPARRMMHLRAGEALTSAPAGELAQHFRNAGDNQRWARYAEQGADLAIAVGDQATTDRLLFDVIIHTRQPAAAIAGLAGKISFAVFPGGNMARELAVALLASLSAGDVPRSEEGAVRFQVARVRMSSDDYTAARADLEVAARYLPAGSVDATVAMIKLGWPYGSLCPAAEHLHWLRRAAEIPMPADPAQRLRLLVERVTALLALGEESGWAEAARIPADTDSELTAYQVVRGAGNIAATAIMWGRYDEAGRRVASALRLAEQYGYQRLHDVSLTTRAHLDWLTGEWAGLAQLATRLAGQDDLQPNARAEATMILGMLHAARGQVKQARECLTSALSHAREHGTSHSSAAALARLSLAEGDAAQALRLTAEPVDAIARKGVWIWATEVAPVRVAALVAAGQADEAAGLAAAMGRGLRGRRAPAPRAALLLCRAMLAGNAGSFGRAAQAWEALPRPYDALLAREQQAHRMLGDRDHEQGVELLTGTAKAFAALGAVADAERTVRTLRGHGIVVRPHRSGRPRHAGLSPRELDVVRLLATGRTDKEIAESLFLSPKTVATHMDSARRKLSVPSRTGLVVAVLEAGLIDTPR